MKPRKLLWLSLLIVASLVVPAFLQFYVVPPQVAMASPDTVTYYFNAYNGAEVWETSPASMIDDNLGTYASTNNAGEVQLNNANNCSGTDLGLISKVELRAYGYGDGGDFIYLRPVFTAGDGTNHTWTPGTSPGWSPYYNITSDTNAPTSWNWSNVQELDVDVAYDGLAKPNPLYIAKVEIRVTYNPPPTVGTIAISPSSMTPQEQWTNITVPVTDSDTLADVNEVYVEVFYDSAGNDPTAPGTADVQTCAILTWTRGGSPEWDIAPTSTTWAINAAGCSNGTDSLTTDNWVFSFKVGKVATQSSPGSDDWDIYAKATDSIGQTGDNYLRDVEMNWYGEITVETSTVSWGIVSPGCSNETSPVVNITYICNGNYAEQIKTSQNWTSVSGNVTLNTTGSPGTGEFSLKADDDDTLADAVQVLSASYTTFDTGTQTTEAGNAENNNHLWLSLGSSGITYDTYSGTLYFSIAP